MKKRLLSALLALALVFVLLPTTALADTTPVTDENVKINGTAVIVGNDISLGEGNGTYSYDKATHTLTLNSATITTTGNIGISFGVPVKGNINYKIELIGTNTISSTSAQAIYVEYDSGLDQQGTQKLSTLTINGSAGSSLILNASGYEKEAIWSKGDFTLSGGTAVTAFSSGKIAVNVGSMTINNSKLSAQSSSYGTTVVLYGLKMIGDTAEFEALNTSSVVSAVLGTSGASENTDWSNYQFTTGSYSGGVLTKSDPEVCSRETLNKYLGLSQKEKSQYIHIAKRTIPALQRTSDVLIAGKNAVVGVETSIPSANGSGTYFYDQASKTLTLNNVTITSGTNAIQFAAAGTYTVKLEGTNKISNVSNGISVTDDKYITSLNVTITGTGSLDISAKGLAINMKKGDLKFENTGEIKLTTSNISPTHNVLSVSGNITIADMEKYKVEGIVQDNTKDGGDTVTLSEASHLKGYQNPDGTAICLKTITITPTPAKDSTISYNRKTLKQGGIITGENGGTATVDSKNNTITLDNFKGNYPLEFNAEFTPNSITLIGDSTLSAVETKYQNLTISGSGSLTVGSIKVHNQKASSDDKPNLTINGATVTVGTAELTTRAIDIDGNLTVTNGSLTATSKSNNVPTVQVGGNASFTGSTVTITNNSTTQGKSGKNSYEVSTGLYVGGTLDIKNAAKVTSTVIGGNAIYAKGDITISGDSTEVNAQNSAYKFSAISTNKTVNISDNSTVKAENLKRHQGDPTGETDPSTGKTYNACPAITGKIANKNTQNKLHIAGFTTSSAGSQNPTEGTPLYLDIAPGSVEPYIHHYNVTITRGDAYTTPQVAANYTIAGQTMYVGKYYKTDVNGNITDGTAQDYNIFCDSANDFTLNNATISSTGTGGSTGVIKTNLNYSSAPFHIKLIGTNSINNAGHHAILGEGENSTIFIENAENASNASLTISGNFLPVYSFGNVTINAEVVIINTNGNLISTNKDGHAGAFDLDSGYKCYASTSVSGLPLETYNAAKSSTYKYLRVTKENLAPTTPTPQTPFTIDGIPAQFVDGGMIATTGVTATSSNNINLPIDRVKWYTFTPVFGSDGRMDSVSDKTEATGNFEAGKYYVVEIKFVQDLSPFESWDMKVSGWSDNDVYRQSVTARNDIEIYFLTPASAATHEHNWAENYDTVYHWKMCTYDGCTAIKDKAPHEWTGWLVNDYRPEVHAQRCNCGYLGSTHSTLKYVAINGEQHQKQCPVDGCGYKIESSTTAHVYAEGSNICTDCGYNKSAPCDHTGDRAYTNNGDGTHKVTCKACGATIVEKQSHEFGPTGACIYCGATQSGGDPTPDNPGTIVIIRPAEEEKPAQQPNPSTGANDLVGLAVAAAVAAALGSAALLRKHD